MKLNLKSVSDKVAEKFEFLNKEKEIQALNDKIQSLEIQLAKAKASAKKLQLLQELQQKQLEQKQQQNKMDTIKTLAYAGLGLAVQTNEK